MVADGFACTIINAYYADHPSSWQGLEANELAAMYDTSIQSAHNRRIPYFLTEQTSSVRPMVR